MTTTPEEPKHPLVKDALSFARQHPTLSVIGAAGVGLLGGIELAAGLLLGAGVVSLLRPKNGEAVAGNGHRVRQQARKLMERAPRELVKRGRAVYQAARGKVAPIEEISEPAPTPPA